MDNKRVSFEFANGFLIIKVDTNADGEALLELKVSLTEVPDEVLALFKK